jgi:uncharacterized protein (DUF302 family)
MPALLPKLAAVLMLAAAATVPALAQTPAPSDDGLVKVRSAYSMDETIQRIRKDIADKGIMFFQAVDQSKLAAAAGINLRPSTLLEFGNPPLGAQFLTSNPYSGLDWPVRVLVLQDESGAVWAAGSPSATASATASSSSRWRRASSSRSPRRSRRAETPRPNRPASRRRHTIQGDRRCRRLSTRS